MRKKRTTKPYIRPGKDYRRRPFVAPMHTYVDDRGKVVISGRYVKVRFTPIGRDYDRDLQHLRDDEIMAPG